MQSQWDSIVFDLNVVIGKLIALSESDDPFDALMAGSYREEVTLTRDSINAVIGLNNNE